MAQAYSMDMRTRVMELYDEGLQTAEVVEAMGCSPSFARRLKQRRRESGSIEPKKPKRPDQRTYDDADEQTIRQLIKQRPDATLAEVVQALGKTAHICTASRTLDRLDLPRKKSQSTPVNRIGLT